MSITLYNIKKWYKMLTGKSVLHVKQDMGMHFEKDKLHGYFNNLKDKVNLSGNILGTDVVPTVRTEQGESIIFPVAVFQYGLMV